MPRWQAYPQHPDEIITPFKKPDKSKLIRSAEEILIATRDVREDIRDTAREFVGLLVPVARILPKDYFECTECLEPKHRNQFYKDARKKNGLYSCCIECHKRLVKRYEFRQRQSLCNSA